jgi:hypothetical protein
MATAGVITWLRPSGQSAGSLRAIHDALAALFPEGRVVRCLLSWPRPRWSGFAVVLPARRLTIAVERSLIDDAQAHDIAQALQRAGALERHDADAQAFFVVRQRTAGERFAQGWLFAWRRRPREAERSSGVAAGIAAAGGRAGALRRGWRTGPSAPRLTALAALW